MQVGTTAHASGPSIQARLARMKTLAWIRVLKYGAQDSLLGKRRGRVVRISTRFVIAEASRALGQGRRRNAAGTVPWFGVSGHAVVDVIRSLVWGLLRRCGDNGPEIPSCNLPREELRRHGGLSSGL